MALRIGSGMAVLAMVAGLFVVTALASGAEAGHFTISVNGGWAIVGYHWGVVSAVGAMAVLWLSREIRAARRGEGGRGLDGILKVKRDGGDGVSGDGVAQVE